MTMERTKNYHLLGECSMCLVLVMATLLPYTSGQGRGGWGNQGVNRGGVRYISQGDMSQPMGDSDGFWGQMDQSSRNTDILKLRYELIGQKYNNQNANIVSRKYQGKNDIQESLIGGVTEPKRNINQNSNRKPSTNSYAMYYIPDSQDDDGSDSGIIKESIAEESHGVRNHPQLFGQR